MLELFGLFLFLMAGIQFFFQWGVLLKNLLVIPYKFICNVLKFVFNVFFIEYPIVGFLWLILHASLLCFVDPYIIDIYGQVKPHDNFLMPILLGDSITLIGLFIYYVENT